MRVTEKSRWKRAGVLAAGVLLVWAAGASASEWNDRTILKFSEPVMVPGATLQAGSYVFELADPVSSHHTVRIMSEDGSRQIAVVHAVPLKRMDPKGDVVMKFEPTDAGSPPAIKAWFYPGSIYGHQFIYPEEQAREIAERTKTIVLSRDAEGDMQKGTLRTYDATGATAEWQGEATTLREWEEWKSKRPASASGAASSSSRSAQEQKPTPADRKSVEQKEEQERTSAERKRMEQQQEPKQEQRQASAERKSTEQQRRESTAPMVETDIASPRVELDDLEDNPEQYMNKTVSVDGEIEEVLGPRLFTIDEPNWGDLAGETLVYVPANFAAPVRENDLVTVTGTVKPFVRSEFEREWGWLGLEPEVEAEVGTKAMLLATKIVGGNSDVAMIVDVGTSGAAGSSDHHQPDRPSAAKPSGEPQVTDLASLARGDEDLVGSRVTLEGVKVEKVGDRGGFFASTGDGVLFVLPATQQARGSAAAGDEVSIEGIVLEMPRDMANRLDGPDGVNDDIYIFATHSSAAGATDSSDR
jgi:hypothetical protein